MQIKWSIRFPSTINKHQKVYKFLYRARYFNVVHKLIYSNLFMQCSYSHWIYINWHVHTMERGWRIRTSDIRFIRHDPQPIELPYENYIENIIHVSWQYNNYIMSHLTHSFYVRITMYNIPLMNTLWAIKLYYFFFWKKNNFIHNPIIKSTRNSSQYSSRIRK